MNFAIHQYQNMTRQDIDLTHLFFHIRTFELEKIGIIISKL